MPAAAAPQRQLRPAARQVVQHDGALAAAHGAKGCSLALPELAAGHVGVSLAEAVVADRAPGALVQHLQALVALATDSHQPDGGSCKCNRSRRC